MCAFGQKKLSKVAMKCARASGLKVQEPVGMGPSRRGANKSSSGSLSTDRPRPVPVPGTFASDSSTEVSGDFLVNAFATAPAELMKAVLVSLDDGADWDSPTLGKAACAKCCSKPEDDMARPGAGERLH